MPEKNESKLTRMRDYQDALNSLIEHGVEGEMIAYGRLESGAYVFLTNERDPVDARLRAFGVYGGNVMAGIWTSQGPEDMITVYWTESDSKQYDVRGFHINESCLPTPLIKGTIEK